jgi:hypothetical protein
MRSKGYSVFSIVLYILGGLVLLYSFWAAYVSYDIISTAIDQGQLVVSGNQFEIAGFVMSNFGQYLIYAVILLALGRLLQVNAYREEDYEIAYVEGDLSEEIADEEQHVEAEERVESGDR